MCAPKGGNGALDGIPGLGGYEYEISLPNLSLILKVAARSIGGDSESFTMGWISRSAGSQRLQDSVIHSPTAELGPVHGNAIIPIHSAGNVSRDLSEAAAPQMWLSFVTTNIRHRIKGPASNQNGMRNVQATRERSFEKNLGNLASLTSPLKDTD